MLRNALHQSAINPFDARVGLVIIEIKTKNPSQRYKDKNVNSWVLFVFVVDALIAVSCSFRKHTSILVCLLFFALASAPFCWRLVIGLCLTLALAATPFVPRTLYPFTTPDSCLLTTYGAWTLLFTFPTPTNPPRTAPVAGCMCLGLCRRAVFSYISNE